MYTLLLGSCNSVFYSFIGLTGHDNLPSACKFHCGPAFPVSLEAQAVTSSPGHGMSGLPSRLKLINGGAGGEGRRGRGK